MTWKEKALQVINPVLAECRHECKHRLMIESELRKCLNKVYPFVQRANHSCKVWCTVVNEAIEDVFGVKQKETKELPLFGELNE